MFVTRTFRRWFAARRAQATFAVVARFSVIISYCASGCEAPDWILTAIRIIVLPPPLVVDI